MVTVLAAYYQRVTGPTYPLSGTISFQGENIDFRFDRSHGGADDAAVRLQVRDTNATATLCWRRFKTDDEWSEEPMTKEGDDLVGRLPWQPPAGKVIYFVRLRSDTEVMLVPTREPVVMRFKGEVPTAILIVHIVTMFGAMLCSTRAGLEAFRESARPSRIVIWTLALLFTGGFILGPIVQKYAFDAYWTGWPWGSDLTDNKTLVALVAWIIAFFGLRSQRRSRFWIFFASLVTLLVFLIPHSIFGSEIDYSQTDDQKVVLWERGRSAPGYRISAHAPHNKAAESL